MGFLYLLRPDSPEPQRLDLKPTSAPPEVATQLSLGLQLTWSQLKPKRPPQKTTTLFDGEDE